MQNPLKQSLFRSTLIYTITDGISKAISFLLLPLISYYIIPSQMGIVANFDVLQNIISLIAGQAIINSIPYFYYERSHKDIATLVSSMLLIVLITEIILFLILLCISPLLQKYLHLTIGIQILTVVASTCYLLTCTNLVLLRLEEKSITFAKLQLLQTIIYISLIVILVIIKNMEAIGRIYATTLSLTTISIIHLISLVKRKYLTFEKDIYTIKYLLKFGIPLLPHSLSFWIKEGLDKVLLTSFCGLAANGIYSMAMSFGATYTIFNNAFNNAYVPYLQKKLTKLELAESSLQKEKKKIVNLTYKITSIFIILYFFSVFVCWIAINYLLSDKYKPSFEYIPWIMLSLTIMAFYNLVIQFIYNKKKTLGLGIITFIGSIIQVALTYLFIKYIGASGIKYSLVICSLIMMLIVWYYSNKVYPLPWFSLKKVQ